MFFAGAIAAAKTPQMARPIAAATPKIHDMCP
jgi:hypothetical protein